MIREDPGEDPVEGIGYDTMVYRIALTVDGADESHGHSGEGGGKRRGTYRVPGSGL